MTDERPMLAIILNSNEVIVGQSLMQQTDRLRAVEP